MNRINRIMEYNTRRPPSIQFTRLELEREKELLQSLNEYMRRRKDICGYMNHNKTRIPYDLVILEKNAEEFATYIRFINKEINTLYKTIVKRNTNCDRSVYCELEFSCPYKHSDSDRETWRKNGEKKKCRDYEKGYLLDIGLFRDMGIQVNLYMDDSSATLVLDYLAKPDYVNKLIIGPMTEYTEFTPCYICKSPCIDSTKILDEKKILLATSYGLIVSVYPIQLSLCGIGEKHRLHEYRLSDFEYNILDRKMCCFNELHYRITHTTKCSGAFGKSSYCKSKCPGCCKTEYITRMTFYSVINNQCTFCYQGLYIHNNCYKSLPESIQLMLKEGKSAIDDHYYSDEDSDSDY
jgi:hypothetical protein